MPLTHSVMHRFSSIAAFEWIWVSLWLMLPAHRPAAAVGQGPLEADFCDRLPAGFYAYPYDCAAYVSCYSSQPELRFCADGKLFNGHLQICDTPDSVDCPEAGIPAPDPQCVDAANGVVLPSSEQCDEFIVCLDQQAVAHKCPEHFLFNPILLICDDPSLVVCYGHSTADSTAATTTASTAMPTTEEGLNECAGKEIGTSFPYPADCQQYILCLGDDEFVKAQCPVNAWYDPETGDCGPDVPKTACQLVETTSTSAATTPSPQQLCADQDLGVSYPLVTDCQKYIMCLGNGESAVVDCIYNSWYDPAIGDCGQDVSPTACQADASPTTTTAVPTTEPSTTATTAATTATPPPYDPDICAGLRPGQYTSYPDQCSKYIVCAEPVPIAFYCTAGYFFNEALQQCVDWALSDCGSEGPAGSVPPSEPGICLDKKGHTFPYTENCQWYIRCVDDNVYMMGVCGPGEYFDPLSGECGSGVAPDACLTGYTTTSSTPSTAASTSTTAATTTGTTAAPESPEPDDDPCTGVPVGALVPHPNDCSKFIQCTSSGPVVWDCAEGQEFSAALQRCMAPWYANCTLIPTAAPPSPTTELPDPDPDDFCRGKPDGSPVPYPGNCSKYIVCREPIAVGYDCPAGEEFSPTARRCLDAQLAQCSARTGLLF